MRAKAFALKALEIDDTLAESHASLGSPLHHLDWDFLTSEKEFQRAIELNPGYASAHEWYGHCLFCVGRFDEGLAQTGRALQLDPLSSVIRTSHAAGFWMSRQWDRAIEHCQKGLEFDPDYLWLLWMLGNAYQGKESYEQALNVRKRAIEIAPGTPIFVADLASTYAAVGQREKALEGMQELNDLSAHRYVMPYWRALIHANLKQKDEAFRWLEEAYGERSGMLVYVKFDPRFDNLRADPRFDGLLRRMKFPSSDAPQEKAEGHHRTGGRLRTDS
jgi:tetratricopeptide (TPR) repeat protein